MLLDLGINKIGTKTYLVEMVDWDYSYTITQVSQYGKKQHIKIWFDNILNSDKGYHLFYRGTKVGWINK